MAFYRSFLVVWLVTQALNLNAQNLVPNSGFEVLRKKPCQFIVNPFIDNIYNYVADWVSPTNGTADMLINKLSSDTTCQIELTGNAYHAHSGTACAGLFTVGSVQAATFIKKPYREYLQCKLLQKLVVGKIYYVELYVISYPFTDRIDRRSYFTNNIGCYFSADSIFQPLILNDPLYILPYKPQINETRVISQTQQWHKISGCFKATDTAQYLTIGNFYTDAETQYVKLDDRQQAAYYLIDDISVTETNLPVLPSLTLQDTVLCSHAKIEYTLPYSPSILYTWQDGTTNPNYTISQAGVYSVTASSGPCFVTDTFHVIQQKAFQLPADTILCRGTPFQIVPINMVAQQLYWSDGSKGATLDVTENGVYWARSEDHGCIQIDSIQVNMVDCPGTIPNIFTPNNDGINDTFFIPGIMLTPWRLEVYNRWGSRIYLSEAYKNDWLGDGLPTGVYYYSLSSQVLQKYYKGWLQIIR